MDTIQTPVVNGEPTTLNQAGQPIIPAGNNGQAPTVVPGSQTDPNLLLKSLQEEREKRRLLEEELARRPATPSDNGYSDEGNALLVQIQALTSKISGLEEGGIKSELLSTYPVLKDKWAEFEQFRILPENKGMAMRTAAKSFLIERGLTDISRPGLEAPTGGPRVPAPTGMSADDVKHLRETDFRKYQELLMKGQIKFE